jgi:CHAD domain-containing protein
MNSLNLKTEERELLTAIQDQAPLNLQKRIKLILLYDQGFPTRTAAQKAGFSPSRARFWKHQFLTQGMDIFGYNTQAPTEPEKSTILGTDVLPTLSQPGVLPDDLMAEAGRKILYFNFLEMLKHEAGTITGENIEDLHDMRVATRRMRAAFDVFGIFYMPKTIAPFLQALRTTGKALGLVRDLDVSKEKIFSHIQQYPKIDQSGLDPLLEKWNKQQDQARLKLITHLNSQEYLDFKNNFSIFLKNPFMGSLKAKKGTPLQTSVRFHAPTLIYTRLASVMAFDAILYNASYSQLHALRIEFKKFRYTLEFFKEVLGSESGGIINQIKDIQDHLGELNDAQVACQNIIRFLKNLDKQQNALSIMDRVNPEGVVNYLATRYAERYRLMISFPEKWDLFNRPELRQNLAKAVAYL